MPATAADDKGYIIIGYSGSVKCLSAFSEFLPMTFPRLWLSGKDKHNFFTLRRRARTGFPPVSPILPLFLRQKSYDFIVIFCPVRKITAGAVLYLPSVRLDISAFSGTFSVIIHGTVAEQTINSVQPLMAGIIFTLSVFKVSVCIFHVHIISHLSAKCNRVISSVL